MKRIILNLACAISLVAAGFSFWVITSPVSVRAAGASGDCRGGGTVTCEFEGAACTGSDASPTANGSCQCISNGQQVLFKSCDNPEDRDPPILD